MSVSAFRAGLLYDFAVDHPEGFKIKDACREYGWSNDQATRAVRAARRILEGDSINLVCDQQGFGEPRLWRLVGHWDGARSWTTIRLRSMESQLESVRSVSMSLVNATDGRTIEGKKARLVNRHIGRLIEDLGELEGRLPGT